MTCITVADSPHVFMIYSIYGNYMLEGTNDGVYFSPFFFLFFLIFINDVVCFISYR
jgi:hypothetical protein